MSEITYTWKRGVDVIGDTALFQKVLALYIGTDTSILAGSLLPHRIASIPQNSLKKYLKAHTLTSDQSDCPTKMPDKGTLVAYAMAGEQLIACVVFVKLENDKKDFTIVNLCMCQKSYEDSDVMKTLLSAAWNVTNDFAVGTVSDNPLMQNYLESIMHRKVDEQEVEQHRSHLEELTKKYIPGAKKQKGKLLFIFFHQQPEMSKEEIETYRNNAYKENQAAYDDMKMQSDTMTWTKHTPSEINYLQREIPELQNLTEKIVYDVGCGPGRHAIQLAERSKNIKVIGIDYVESVIQVAEEERNKMECPESVEFHACDARDYIGKAQGDVVLCLYDVICSSLKQRENDGIVKTVYDLCKDEGYAAFSAMNYERSARGHFEIMNKKSDLRNIYKVQISKVMGTTGDVFVTKKQLAKYEDDPTLPAHALIDEKNHVIYRRERFDRPGELPIVRIVCDLRYTENTMRATLEGAGFTVLNISPRCAGFRNKMKAKDGKELVAICQKKVPEATC